MDEDSKTVGSMLLGWIGGSMTVGGIEGSIQAIQMLALVFGSVFAAIICLIMGLLIIDYLTKELSTIYDAIDIRRTE